jgi:hypothetical protein
MYLSPEEKGKIFKKHGKSEKDSGNRFIHVPYRAFNSTPKKKPQGLQHRTFFGNVSR